MKRIWIAVLILWLFAPLFWEYTLENVKILMALTYPFNNIRGVSAG